jgi:hypothetical protein
MIEQEEVLFRPIHAGHYKYTDLIDGTLSLADVMLCNEALDITAENDRRAHEYERTQTDPRR